MTRPVRILVLLAFLAAVFIPASTALAQQPVVRAILFFSPTCPHCHQVMTQDLPIVWANHNGWDEVLYVPTAQGEEDIGPAIYALFGEQLEILYINTYTALGHQIYASAVERLDIPQNRLGVPTLIIDETDLVGSGEIPAQFPGLVEQGLARGGVDWPDIPGLQDGIAQLEILPQATGTPEEAVETPTAGGSATESHATSPAPTTSEYSTAVPTAVIPINPSNPSVLSKLRQDPLGNTISIVVLIGITFTAFGVGVRWVSNSPHHSDHQVSIWVPLLSLIGMIVAGYLAFVETTGSEAVCGPVGDCNTVQQSEYAVLFAVLPLGIFGELGYIMILIAWLVARFEKGRIADLARLAIFWMTAFGTLLSIYLTFLEPFVIGATCAWCLSSAVIITVQLWLSIEPAKMAWSRIKPQFA
jgi:uncharacterized membrane protein